MQIRFISYLKIITFTGQLQNILIMKNLIIVFFILISPNLIFGQKKVINISETKIGTVSCKYSQSIDLEKGDTLTYVFLGFSNAKYTTITDIVSIMFLIIDDSSNVIGFVKNLKSAYNEMGSKSTISWDKEEYKINLYDFTDNLYLYEAESSGSGYTILSKKQVEKLYTWLEGIGFKE